MRSSRPFNRDPTGERVSDGPSIRLPADGIVSRWRKTHDELLANGRRRALPFGSRLNEMQPVYLRRELRES
jgi:hypothetical protein